MPTLLKPSGFLVLVLCVFGPPATGNAEVVRLKSGEVLLGTLTHYYGGIAALVLRDGTTRAIGQNEIATIEFTPLPEKGPKGAPPEPAKTPAPASDSAEPTFLNLSRPVSRYATPMATFQTWRQAAIAGNVDAMVDCYATFKQKEVRKQMKDLSKEARERMRETTARTDFAPAEPFYQGDRALLEVKWANGLYGDSQVLQFIVEKNEWKIVQ